VDPKKDQSYMLSSLNNEQLKRLILPLGQYTKEQVRKIAGELDFKAGESKESQDVCFLPDGDYSTFLKEMDADVNHPGDMVDRKGALVGQHHGLAFYTIGQRKGLGIYAPEPTYVLEKDIANNRLIVGGRSELGRSTMVVFDPYWHLPPAHFPITCRVEIRYHSKPSVAKVKSISDSQVLVEFAEPQRDITPGQAAVFYTGEEVIGSGIIALNI
jgi:tRNA-specific 2-thiouridylase